jgi:hypothetical protein
METTMTDLFPTLWVSLVSALLAGCTPAIVPPSAKTFTEILPNVERLTRTAHPATCHVDLDASARGRTIKAYATAPDAALAGTFMLEVKADGANTSRSRQRGEFSLAPGETAQLARLQLAGSPYEHIDGELSLQWAGGSASCKVK